ncbi:MAG: PAS domain S-box protein, partial [Candidatus Firestonebacteria bacterium]|nr:PAS domain S-box protein [Candidatus Firestonebacteria bacterium]
QAKSFRSDTERVMQWLQEGAEVMVSLAPAYASVYPGDTRECLVGALRQLGFSRVEETALGAEITARETADFVRTHAQQAAICSACPAVVHYVEMYLPALVKFLVPVVSPMVAHARLLKTRWGQKTRVVFIGPCLAKKMEAERPEYAGLVDAVLTFEELDAWLVQENLSLETASAQLPDAVSRSISRCFPLLGGLAKTAAWGTDLLTDRVAAVSGFEMINELFSTLETETRPWIVEPLFCREGCINGPGIPANGQVYAAKQRVLDYAAQTPGPIPAAETSDLYLAHYQARAPLPVFGEEAIKAVLAQTGKSAPEDQLDCGACGYNSCRDKAVAVLRGMAEPEMCIPQMLRQAEHRTDKIMETTPNGIVIVDEHLQILSMNLAFRAMFQAGDALLGKPVATLLDPADFEKIASRAEEKIEGRAAFPNYQLICHQILYPLK